MNRCPFTIPSYIRHVYCSLSHISLSKKIKSFLLFIIVYLINHSLFQNPPTTPAIKGECLLAVNKNGIQFLKLQTHVSYRCLLHCLSFVRKQVCLYLYCMTLSKNMVEECEWGKNPHKNLL